MKKTYSSIKTWLMITLVVSGACTDLEVNEKDSVVIETESGEFAGIDPVTGLASAYADLRNDPPGQFTVQNNVYALMEVTTDEYLVPTRGTDWGDNGVWRSLHQHTWEATHEYVLNAWNNLNSNVFRLNQLLAPESNANAQQLAEGKFLRAFNMFYIYDLFRQVPFRGVNDGVDVDPQVFTPQEAFNFIEKDLTEALEDLPQVGPGTENTKTASQASAHFMLAKLYLNKHIYLDIDAPAAEDMTKVIEHVDAIKAAGFNLHDGYFEIFEPSSDSETIFWTDGSVGNRIWNGLHYSQGIPTNTGGGWNGFATTAEFFALFEGDPDSNFPGSNQEERRGYVPNTPRPVVRDCDDQTPGVQPCGGNIGYGFLMGQQYNDAGEKLKDRAGNDLVYTKELPGLTGNNERTGIRVIKYNPDEGVASHYILARYADAHLMKIEAILRGGTSGDDPLALFNELRTIRNASTKTSIDLDEILDERGRELYIEGWRRNDQIRFGTFTQPFALKDNTEEFRIRFPIPANAIVSNPNLVQNFGY